MTFKRSRDIKAELQAALDSGEIQSRKELFERAESYKLTITRGKGQDYASFRGQDGKHIKVRFNFDDELPHPPKRPARRRKTAEVDGHEHYWVYALIAYSGSEKACYIGQTIDIQRRLYEHLTKRRPGRGSYHLFEWAEKAQVEVQAAILTSTAGTHKEATELEGYWLLLATKAGFITPGSENWGQLPRPTTLAGQPNQWPSLNIDLAAKPLALLVNKGIEKTSVH
ncbi:GIY-YIG nuclease family protein [Alcanivorax sp.]|uniref:GIY-YIG nuclease family protein n=1 Tax=Alcanivorax sp. TaxID=1872427 RepID=UPI002B27BC18|nr:GIY-YIG nuclease family protein [Alcanivorax sp.]